MNAYLTGGSWITAEGSGLWSAQEAATLNAEIPRPPSRKDFDRPPSRYGRFDAFTRLGWAGIALALKDAGLDQAEQGRPHGGRPIGIVAASGIECLDTDEEFYQTTLDEGGSLSSPHLFSYTLPNIVLGECAVHFQLTGPTLSIGDGGTLGGRALEVAMRFLAQGEATTMIAGWLESSRGTEPGAPRGALFVVLEAQPKEAAPEWRLTFHRGKVTRKGQRINTLGELFPKLVMEKRAAEQ